jgi:hypothetical protein
VRLVAVGREKGLFIPPSFPMGYVACKMLQYVNSPHADNKEIFFRRILNLTGLISSDRDETVSRFIILPAFQCLADVDPRNKKLFRAHVKLDFTIFC